MKYSNRIFWALLVGAALWTASASCTTEERDIEEDHLFVCTNTNDCLSGSECVKQGTDTQGRCVKEENVQRCHDYDNDGFYAADPDYPNACSGITTGPLDCDDTNPHIYPRDFEDACDGLDNNCDGCIDGNCPEGKDCGAEPDLCEPLDRPCYGVQFEGVCSKDVAGLKRCIDGRYVEGQIVGGKFTEGSCKSAEEIGYVQDELEAVSEPGGIKYCDKLDNDCNGIIDDYFDGKGCPEVCEPATDEGHSCFILSNTLYYKNDGKLDEERFETTIKQACNQTGNTPSSCACIGVSKCSDDKKVCHNSTWDVTLEEGMTLGTNPNEGWKENCNANYVD